MHRRRPIPTRADPPIFLPGPPQVFHAPPAANTTNGGVHPIPTKGRPWVPLNPGGQVMGRINPNPTPYPRSMGLTRTLDPLPAPPTGISRTAGGQYNQRGGHPIPTGGRTPLNPNPRGQVMGRSDPNPTPNPRSIGLTRTLDPLPAPPTGISRTAGGQYNQRDGGGRPDAGVQCGGSGRRNIRGAHCIPSHTYVCIYI